MTIQFKNNQEQVTLFLANIERISRFKNGEFKAINLELQEDREYILRTLDERAEAAKTSND